MLDLTRKVADIRSKFSPVCLVAVFCKIYIFMLYIGLYTASLQSHWLTFQINMSWVARENSFRNEFHQSLAFICQKCQKHGERNDPAKCRSHTWIRHLAEIWKITCFATQLQHTTILICLLLHKNGTTLISDNLCSFSLFHFQLNTNYQNYKQWTYKTHFNHSRTLAFTAVICRNDNQMDKVRGTQEKHRKY